MASNRGIEALVEQWDPVLRRAFLAAIAAIQDRVQVSLVAELLERGDIIGAIETVGLDPAAFRPLDAAIMQAFEAGGSDTADRIPALRQPSGHRLQVRFDVRNPRAETWLREHSSGLITEIIADQRQAIRQHLTAGMEAGANPRTVAVDLVGRINPASGRREGGVIGLTAAQEEWCRRYAAELAAGDRAALTRALRDKRFDRTVEKALREGAQIPAEMRAKMVAAYRNRALKYRADVIGRTEAMRALHRSQIEAFEQAISIGQVDETAVEKVWRSSVDARVRDSHRALHGKAVGFREAFITTEGDRLQYPGDPDAPARSTVQCRCWLNVRIDHLAAAVAAERGRAPPAAPAASAAPVAGEPIAPAAVPAPVAPTAIRNFATYEMAPQALQDGIERKIWRDADDARSFVTALMVGVPETEALDVSIAMAGGDISVAGTTKSGAATVMRRLVLDTDHGWESRMIDEETPATKVVHDLFTLDKRYQGGGHAKTMLRASIEQYVARGITRIETHANIDRGGYVWARLGFVPSYADTTRLRGYLRTVVEMSKIDDRDQSILLAIIQRSADDDLMYDLAMAKNVAGERIGKDILSGADWQARVDLSDPVQYRRVMEALAR